jgi:hypothetical protein
LDDETLAGYGLEWDDTQEASDHLPRVFDISLDPNVEIINDNPVPKKIAIVNSYPNPFNPITTITVHFETNYNISLQVFDINGRLIDLLFDGEIEAGTHEFHWDGNSQPSGVYFIKLLSIDYNQTRKMVLLK